ncbi:Dabb family protein [Rhizorhabdus wittichii]|jgi:hypothetical protein|uniref:Dabb family protein n=2 Tax=Rhizorhabdus wittichii TaxID=160791 RepID=A0A975CYN5_9SPHN|nr:Dabb family protein [Rhizorhabdus wittichii]QTH19727.1 Dabb family protein [Rhizorhabdus wittichii]
MYNRLLIPTFAPDRRDAAMAVIAEASAAIGAEALLFAPTLPGVYNGGDAIWRASFADRAACDAALDSDAWAPAAKLLADPAATTHLDAVGYASGAVGGPVDGGGLYRVALFRAAIDPTPERLAAFGAQTAAMPRAIRSIRRWQLATADEASGLHGWTHVWEQEYADRAGLEGAYMMHPAHWAHVERWFDPEYTEFLVHPLLVHSFCAIDRPVIVA